jgi:hypothetical protein
MLGCQLAFSILHEESHLIILFLEILNIFVDLKFSVVDPTRPTMMRPTMMGQLIKGLIFIELLRRCLCPMGSFVGRALLTLGRCMVTAMNRAFLFSLSTLHLLFFLLSFVFLRVPAPSREVVERQYLHLFSSWSKMIH